jgi:hypothetical protein
MHERPNRRHAVFLDGPVGVGKTTFGRLLATEFSGGFIDGDDHSASDLPWFASSLSTSRSILSATTTALESGHIVFIAYPIRCINWVFFCRRLRASGITPILVGLQADETSIADADRSRHLSRTELRRSREMAVEGYGRRHFSDFLVQADSGELYEVIEDIRSRLIEKLNSAV